jgi:hypothetical protein
LENDRVGQLVTDTVHNAEHADWRRHHLSVVAPGPPIRFTLLNCLTATMPARERVITCEEVFELADARPYVTRVPGHRHLMSLVRSARIAA